MAVLCDLCQIDELEFKMGYTYTFNFWGISQWLDRLSTIAAVDHRSARGVHDLCSWREGVSMEKAVLLQKARPD